MVKLLSTGIKALDGMIDSVPQESLVTVIGPAGSGKTLLSMHFLKEGLRLKEECLFISVSSNLNSAENAKKILLLSGKTITALGFPPSPVLKKEDAVTLRKLITKNKIRRAVLDCALSNASGPKSGIVSELANLLRAEKVTSYLVQRGGTDIGSLENHYFPVDPDIVIFPSFYEFFGALVKCLSVLKNKGRHYDSKIRELRVKGGEILLLEQVQANTGITGAGSVRTAASPESGGGPIIKELTGKFNKGKAKADRVLPHYKYHIQSVEDFKRLLPGTGLVYVYSEIFKELYSQGLLASLSSVVTESVRGSLLRKSYEPYVRGGALYGVAKNLELDLLFYRKDLLKKYGLKVPASLKDLLLVSKRICASEKNLEGLVYVDTAYELHGTIRRFLQYLLNFGADINKPFWEFSQSSEAVSAVAYLLRLLKSGIISREYLDPKEKWHGMNKFMEGGAVFFHGTSDIFGMLEADRCKVKFGKEAGYIAFPGSAGPGKTPIAQAAVLVLPAVSENKETALEFLKYLLTKGSKVQALVDTPFPPKLSLYSDGGILKERPYYEGVPDLFEKAVLIEEYGAKERDYILLYQEILFALLEALSVEAAMETAGRLIRAASVAEEMTLPNGVRKAVDLVSNAYAGKIRLSDMASAAGLSQNHFNGVFLKATGFSAMQYLANFRVLKAMEFLKDTSLNISETAYKCGYPDPLHYSAAFKRGTGLSPAKYRELRRLINEKQY